MPPPRSSGRTVVVASLAALALGAAAWAFSDTARPKPELGLLTTLPIYWSESFDIGETLDSEGKPHWVRSALESEYALRPLDTLTGDESALERLDYLLLAQPRALAPEENVALDDWVREGGHALIFADPFLTDASRFAIGDRRRPQDVVLLSPILRRWGLELRFDEAQPDGEHTLEFEGEAVPVNLAGTLVAVEGSAPSDCSILAEGLIARCDVGKGEVTVVADAALLEHDRGAADQGSFASLVERSFGR